MDSTVRRVAKTRTQLGNFPFRIAFLLLCLRASSLDAPELTGVQLKRRSSLSSSSLAHVARLENQSLKSGPRFLSFPLTHNHLQFPSVVPSQSLPPTLPLFPLPVPLSPKSLLGCFVLFLYNLMPPPTPDPSPSYPHQRNLSKTKI